MPSLFFWKQWSASYRSVWLALAGVFIFSLGFLWFSYLQGAEGVVGWEKIQEQKTLETTVHEFRVGPFVLTVPAESYVIFEYLQGSDLVHNRPASYIFLVVLVFSALVLLTVITTLEGMWYFVGMGFFILFIVSLRLDVLTLFGHRGMATTAVVLALYLVLSYFFKSIRTEITFTARLLTFTLLTVLLAIIIGLFATIQIPFLHLAVTAYVPALIFTLLFIIMVAHEILVSFVYIASQGATKSLRHFSIISVIYLGNVLITCLHEMGVIHWDFVYINLYLLVSISAILGVWGFRLREPLYENILPFAPFGAFFYLALASICFVTIGQLLGNYNDATLRVIRDLIIFTHFAFGVVFLMYLFSNFLAMMADRVPVYKILYKPNRMPHFTFRLAGIIVTLAFVFTSHWRDYVYYSFAGFYNYAADLYMLQGNEKLGRAFYEKSRSNAYQNHRANYALAMIKASRLDFANASANLERANTFHATDFSAVNAGNVYLWQRDYFSAIDQYRREEMRNASAALSNNLGLAYAKIHKLDSATYYMSEARAHQQTQVSAETNFLAMAAAEYLPVKTDSVLNIFTSSSAEVAGNALALSTLFHQDVKIKQDPVGPRELDLYSATLLNNYLIKNAKALDTTFTTKALAIASDSVNFAFSEALKASLAYGYYHQGNVSKAQELLAELVYLSQSYRGKYNYIMGLWALEQQHPEIAHSYFKYAVDEDYKQAKFYDAIALTENRQLTEAALAWDSVMIHGSAEERNVAVRIRRILTLNPAQALTLTDAEKYQYCRYKVTLSDTVQLKKLVATFTDDNYKAQVLLDMAKRQYQAGNIIPAIHLYRQTAGLKISDKNLYASLQHFELAMLASRQEIRLLAEQINKGVTFDGAHALEKMLYTALVSEAGDPDKAARNYEIVGTWNPYFEDGVLAAADFFRRQDPKGSKAYTLLAEAIQVNAYSIRLLKAYAAEAARQGFDEYAASAMTRAQEAERLLR